MISSRSFLLLLALLASAAALTQARAAPLDADTCNKLMIEHGTLEDAGAEQNMAKGTEWAKANLAPEKIEQVRRFIELEALILFRCRSKSRITLPPEPEPEQDKDGHGKDAQDKSTAGKQETTIAKTKDGSGAPTKADPKKQKAQPAKKAAGEPTAKQAKSAAQQPKGGTASSHKGPPPKAKVDEASKAPSPPTPPPQSPPDANLFGGAFDSAPK